jgi:hypothetical protein
MMTARLASNRVLHLGINCKSGLASFIAAASPDPLALSTLPLLIKGRRGKAHEFRGGEERPIALTAQEY